MSTAQRSDFKQAFRTLSSVIRHRKSRLEWFRVSQNSCKITKFNNMQYALDQDMKRLDRLQCPKCNLEHQQKYEYLPDFNATYDKCTCCRMWIDILKNTKTIPVHTAGKHNLVQQVPSYIEWWLWIQEHFCSKRLLKVII